jgi:Cytochrome c554 and c-prime
VYLSLLAWAQVPATMADQMTSDERLARPGWWPRKGDAPRSDYVGPEVCAECHFALAQGQQQHAMAHSSMPVSQAEGLRQAASYDNGPYHYSIVPDKNGATYTVTNSGQSFSAPILWAFGSGKHGQSFLFENKGDLYEARISYYRSLGINITPDHPTGIPASLDDAIGRKIDKDEAPKCLSCHATAAITSGKLDASHMILGVSCEGCHGPGVAHVALARAGTGVNPGMISNPGRLDPVSSVDFCGSCHRTWWDINELGYHGLRNVRFAVYRLQTSRCWGKGDARITCIACHDPHKPLVTELSAYDEKCLSCHVKSASLTTSADHPGRGCPVSVNHCVGCHMPTYQLPQMHSPFTDHRIRIVRDIKAFPDE